jgi:hypothetical protein
MAMAIERKNSFHLLLSDDELQLLKLLAEREGLNASDYLRSLLRQMAGASTQAMQVMRLGSALDFQKLAEQWATLETRSPLRKPPKRGR